MNTEMHGQFGINYVNYIADVNFGTFSTVYEIDKMNEAFYYFIQFDAEGNTPAELESRVRILDNVIRYLCVRRDEA